MENKEIEKKGDKPSKFKTVILFLVMVVIIGGLGAFFGVKYLGNNESDDNKKNNNEENVDNKKLDVNSEVVKNLFEVFREDKPMGLEKRKENVNTDIATKRYIAFTQLKEADLKKKNCSELNFKSKTRDSDEFMCESYDSKETTVFDASLLEKEYKKIFGQDVEFSNGDFYLQPFTKYYYDSSNNQYIYLYMIGGMEADVYTHTHTLESISQTDSQLVLNTKKVSFCNNDDLDLDDIEKEIIYTFKLEDETGNYIFVNREEKIVSLKDENNTNKVEQLSDEEKENILEIIKFINSYNLAKYDNLDIENLSNQEKLIFAIEQLTGYDDDGDFIGISDIYVEDIIDRFYRYFPKNQSFVIESIGSKDDVYFEYDEVSKKYKSEFYQTYPGIGVTNTHSFIVSAKKENGIYTVEVNTFYESTCNGGECGVRMVAGSYKDANSGDIDKSYNVKNWYNSNGEINQSVLDGDYKLFKKQMPTYTYKFKLEDGNYKLISKMIG